MLDGLFYYFAGTGVVIGVKMEDEIEEDFLDYEGFDFMDDGDEY